MIEALGHDLGKASRARFEDHAETSADLLRNAGFVDDAVLNLIEQHHNHKSSSGGESILYLLQLADRLASSGGRHFRRLHLDCEAFFGKAFFRKV